MFGSELTTPAWVSMFVVMAFESAHIADAMGFASTGGGGGGGCSGCSSCCCGGGSGGGSGCGSGGSGGSGGYGGCAGSGGGGCGGCAGSGGGGYGGCGGLGSSYGGCGGGGGGGGGYGGCGGGAGAGGYGGCGGAGAGGYGGCGSAGGGGYGGYGGYSGVPYCGRRKKRSTLGEKQQLNTEATALCPQAEWKSVIRQNLLNDVLSSEYAIHSAFHRNYDGGKWFVSCMFKPHVTADRDNTPKIPNQLKAVKVDGVRPAQLRFSTNGVGYCSHGDDQIWCTVIALTG